MSDDVLVIYETEIELLEAPNQPYELLEAPNQPYELLEVAQQGLPGINGLGANVTVVFATPAVSWQVLHNLNRIVSVMVMDDYGNVVVAEVQHTSFNDFYVRFGFPQSGKVIYQ